MIAGLMSPEQFRAWRAGLGLTQLQAAAKLGLSVSMLKNYESGFLRRRDAHTGELIEVEIPRAIALACAAIAAGLKPIGD
jgi:transcriptional regulator with XRE-family HTH domain